MLTVIVEGCLILPILDTHNAFLKDAVGKNIYLDIRNILYSDQYISHNFKHQQGYLGKTRILYNKTKTEGGSLNHADQLPGGNIMGKDNSGNVEIFFISFVLKKYNISI